MEGIDKNGKIIREKNLYAFYEIVKDWEWLSKKIDIFLLCVFIMLFLMSKNRFSLKRTMIVVIESYYTDGCFSVITI